MSTARRVTFNKGVKVHPILSIYDYKDSEISAAWYDRNEMDKITQRCFKLLHKFEKSRCSKSKNGPKYCMRGLEGHTTQGSMTKKSNRSAAYTAALDEQERHWNESADVRMQAISDVYQRTSSSCQMWAQVVGNRDQQAVEAYLHDDDDEEEVVTTSAPSSTVSSSSSLKSKASSCLNHDEFRVVQAFKAAVSAQAA